jgi:hypothetical protein
MTDSQMLAEILKQVREIRRYIARQPDCPQDLWDDERSASERDRQMAALGLSYDQRLQLIQQQQTGPWTP